MHWSVGSQYIATLASQHRLATSISSLRIAVCDLHHFSANTFVASKCRRRTSSQFSTMTYTKSVVPYRQCSVGRTWDGVAAGFPDIRRITSRKSPWRS
jgi:hypothetical protein